jgi:SsrA-binding protein
MAKPSSHANMSPRIANRRALHEYHILDKLETGIELTGSEVKSIRQAQVQLGQGFVRVEANGSLMLHAVDIAQYQHAGGANGHETTRPRKLLAHKREIQRLIGQTAIKGTTLVPLAMYFKRGYVKVEVAVVQGKQAHDKRQTIKERDADRDIRRALTRKVL